MADTEIRDKLLMDLEPKKVGGAQVVIATTEEEREEIYRLRYEVYIDEMAGGHRHSEADLTKRELRDDWDQHAIQMYVRQEGKIVAAVRTNLRRDGPLECEDLFEIARLTPAYPDRISLSSRLVMHPKIRGSNVLKQLSSAAFQVFSDSGACFGFIDCHPRLLPLYSRLGFRIYRPGFRHPKYTFVIPMVMVKGDLAHLERVKSPFLPIAKRFPVTTEWLQLLLAEFPAAAHTFISADMDANAFWDLLRVQLEQLAGGEQCDLFSDLTPDETKELVSSGQIVSCHASDTVLRSGDTGREIYVILDGSFQVIGSANQTSEFNTLDILMPGDIFGEMAFLTEGVRCASVMAMEDSNVLILNSKVLDQLVTIRSALAAKMFRNLARIVETRLQDAMRR